MPWLIADAEADAEPAAAPTPPDPPHPEALSYAGGRRGAPERRRRFRAVPDSLLLDRSGRQFVPVRKRSPLPPAPTAAPPVVGSGPPHFGGAVRSTPVGLRSCRERRPFLRVASQAFRSTTEEAPSAPSPASTTGSASPRCASSVPTVSRSASSPSATRCGWPRSPTSTSSRWPRWPGRPSASSWTTASSSTSRRMKDREARKNQVNTVIKEMKLRPKIDPHDYETKKGHVVRFLKQGDKVKITIMFRGREQSRPELGFRLLQRLADGRRGARLRRVRAEAGRPQHDHGAGPAQEEGRREGRARRPRRPPRRTRRRRAPPTRRPPGRHRAAVSVRRTTDQLATTSPSTDEETPAPCRRTRRTAARRSASR